MSKGSITFSSTIARTNFVWRGKTINSSELRTVFLILGFYTFLTIIYLPQAYLGNLSVKNPSQYPIMPYVVGHFLWFLTTLVIIRLTMRFPLAQPLRLKKLGIHILLAVFISTIYTLLYYLVLGLSEGVGFSHLARISKDYFLLAKYITNSFVFYVGILMFTEAFFYYKLYKEREFRLQQAELEALKMQLHPHFLFNTLNAISALVSASPQDATKTISQLSDLLRLTLSSGKTQEVTLKEELDFLRKYVQLQQTLLQERLEVEWLIEPETLDALVPNLLLQPLIENSIQHGIAPKEEGGRIQIFSRRAGDELLLEIKDNGLGLESNKEKNSNRIGLINSKARLKYLYGDAQKFEINTPRSGGWHVAVTLPFREQPQKVQ